MFSLKFSKSLQDYPGIYRQHRKTVFVHIFNAFLQGATDFFTINVIDIITGICSIDSHKGQGHVKNYRADFINHALNISLRHESDLYNSSRSLFQLACRFVAAGYADLCVIFERDF